jgi:hypothetical protein
MAWAGCQATQSASKTDSHTDRGKNCMLREDPFPGARGWWLSDDWTRLYDNDKHGDPLRVFQLIVHGHKETLTEFHLTFTEVHLTYQDGKRAYEYADTRYYPSSILKTVEALDKHWFIKKFDEVSAELEPEVRTWVRSKLPLFSPPTRDVTESDN